MLRFKTGDTPALNEGMQIMTVDFKKTDRDIYQPKTTPSIIDVPEMVFIAIDNGYAIDINDNRRHHEIYLSDPRKTAPEKLKTVIRHPIKSEEA